MKNLNAGVGAQDNVVMSQLAAARGLPSYAGLPKYNFDPATGIYNLKASNMRKFHAGLIRAGQGTGKLNVAVIGDSSMVGYNGSVVKESLMIPRVIQDTFCARTGYAAAGGFIPFVLATGTVGDKLSTVAGSINTSSIPGLLTINSGGAILWSPDRLGTEVTFIVSNLSVNNFTYQIDGGSAVAVTTNATTTWKKVTVTGLTYGTHTLRINAVGGAVYLSGGMVTNASGVAFHNFALGGTRAASGTAAQNWTDTVSTASVYLNRKLALDTLGVTLDAVICVLGANDISGGDTPANAVSGLQTIHDWYPDADYILGLTAGFDGGTMANYNTYSGLKYALADTLDAPLYDIRCRMGDSTEALANGLLGADNAHANDAMNIELGRVLGGALAIAFGGLSANKTPHIEMVPTGTVGFASQPSPSGWVEYTP